MRHLVTLAFGGEQYQRFAENLSISAQRYRLRTILITSPEAKPNPTHYARIIRVPCGKRIEDIWALKLDLHDILRLADIQGDFAFLDADAIIISDPRSVFAALREGFYFPVESVRPPEWTWAFSREMGKLASAFCGHLGSIPQLNGGFFLWSHDSAVAKAWFDQAKRALSFLRSLGLDREEPAMSLALCAVPETHAHWDDTTKVCQLWCAAHAYTASVQHGFALARMPWWDRIEAPAIVHHGSGYMWSERYMSMVRDLHSKQPLDQYPHVTVFVLTHARVRWLQEALFSLLKQDYPRFDIVVLNDCDRQDLTLNHDRITIKNTARYATVGQKRNAAFEHIREYAIFVDDDDLVTPWHLSAHVANLQRNRAVASVSLRCLSFTRSEQCLGFGSAPIDVMFHGSVKARFPERMTGEDQDFRAALTRDGYVSDLIQPNPSYIYSWGNGAHHISGNPDNARAGFDEDVAHRLASGEEPSGSITLRPAVRDDIAHWWLP